MMGLGDTGVVLYCTYVIGISFLLYRLARKG